MPPEHPRGGVISSIDPHSIAEDLGWQVGDEMLSVNGHELHDVIDFRFYSAEESIVVVLRRGDQTGEFDIDKDPDEPLGVEFRDVLFDGVRTCGAHCVFCFVEQLPPGLRKPLYLKDDDYRLSFLHGNFVTLANVTDEDLQRIIEQRLSPLYVSVHTTEPELRDRMLGRGAPSILDQIDTLAQGRIALHTQIVLCRGINDGQHLDTTVEDLAERHPAVQSIAIVPAGLTAHRRNQTPIGAIDSDYSRSLLKRVRLWQRLYLHEKGTRLVWAADEFYLSAGEAIPDTAVYEGFPQSENGVGLARRFRNSVYQARRALPEMLPRPTVVSMVTGTLAAPLLEEWARSVRTKNLKLNVFPITNRLLGSSVTVAGLIAGKDIIDQLAGRDLGDLVLIPSVAVRDGVFLDDVSVSELQAALGARVAVVEPRPYHAARRIIKEAEQPMLNAEL